MDILKQYEKSGYKIPADKLEEKEKLFDYWDMIGFAQMCVDSVSLGGVPYDSLSDKFKIAINSIEE